MFNVTESTAPGAHRLDLIMEMDMSDMQPIELGIEELTETLHFASDCASSVGCASTTGGCVGGSASSAASIGSMGSIVSSGG